MIEAAVAAALGGALGKIGESLIGKAVEAGVGPLDEAFKEWLYRDLKQAQSEEALRQAVGAALDRALEELSEPAERLALASKFSQRPPEVYELLAACAVEMAQPEEALIPARLLKGLGLEEGQRRLLARYLFHLRRQLSGQEAYARLIAYADSLAGRGLLSGLAEQVSRAAEAAERAASLLEQMAGERRLSADDQGALEKYLAACRQRWGRLLLPLIRKRAGQATEAELKTVFVPLTLKDERAEQEARQKAEKARRGSTRPAEAGSEEEAAPPVGFDVLFNRYARWILIGGPGSGKTTLLRRAALAFAEGRARQDLNWPGAPLLPILIRLRNFGVFLNENRQRFCEPCPGSLVAFFDQQLRDGERLGAPADFFDRRLEEGNCLVLLDGLDEVSTHRVEVAQHVSAFIRRYGDRGNRIGLSSRPKGYESDVRLQLSAASLALAEVQPLRPEGIRQLIANLFWLLEAEAEKRAADSERLGRTILASPNLSAIAGTPLFCSALVQVYKYHGAELPQRRVDVLAEIVDLLLGFWHAQKQDVAQPELLAQEDGTTQEDGRARQFRDVDEAVSYKLRRLSHLAFHMQSEARQAELDGETAREVLAAYLKKNERVKDKARAWEWADHFLYNSHERSGLLVESSPGVYSFVHKNFMEFLAASALVNQSSKLPEIALQHLEDDWWEQVILLAGAHDKTPDDVRERLIEGVLQAAEGLPKGEAAWKRHLSMAGWLGRDMGGHLPGPTHELLEETLYAASTDAALLPATRADLADVLDGMGYRPPDLHRFVLLSGFAYPLYLARYPVTNAQYGRFLQEANFKERRCWLDFPELRQPDANGWCNPEPFRFSGEAGWRWLQKARQDPERSPDGKVVWPRYWNDANLGINRPGAPVVGVSWWEANAYCRWLLEHWAELEEGRANPQWRPALIRLPTESEWVCAAGGRTPEDRFPWDAAGAVTQDEAEILRRANVDESQIGRTTPAWLYPQGESPLKIMDLAGNVWEWQANYYDKDHDYLALRGGSFDDQIGYARLSVRNYSHPSNQWYRYGFRVVALPNVS